MTDPTPKAPQPVGSMWDRRYDEQQYLYGEALTIFLREAAHYLPQRAQVLCLAEGEGRNAVFLAQRELRG